MKAKRFSVVLATCLVCGCAGYGPQSLDKGASVETATHAMGPPTGELALADGGRRLEYARGPFGRHTYMLDFDAKGQLLQWEQVLTEARFNTIHAGMDAAEVRALIGRASEQRQVGWRKQGQVVWAYRYETPFCQWFQVGLDPQGKVVDTAYGPDPLCDVGDVKDGTN